MRVNFSLHNDCKANKAALSSRQLIWSEVSSAVHIPPPLTLSLNHLITITLDLLLWTGDGNLSTLLVHHRRSSRTESGTLMKASKLPQFQKELHLSNLHTLQNTGTNPNTRVSRNKITNNFRCMSNGTHFHLQQFHTHWSDLLDFPVSQRNNYVLSVKETIMLTKSNQNSRNSILWVGCKTDITEWTVKPKESKTWQVAIIALWQSCSVSPCKRVSSMNANTVWPKHLRHDRTGLEVW